MVMEGVPLIRIAAFLGNSVKMVEAVYAKYSSDYLADAIASLGRGAVGSLEPESCAQTSTRSEKLDLTARKAS